MKIHTALLGLLVVGASTLDATGQVPSPLLSRLTRNPIEYPHNSGYFLPFTHPLHDLDGDGTPEMIQGNWIHWNDGHGTFRIDGRSLVAWPRSFFPVGVGDLDGDGDLDAVGMDQVLKNDGKGNFGTGAGPSPLAGLSLMSVRLVDMDLDGDLDLVALFQPEGSSSSNLRTPVQVWHNDGRGGFAKHHRFTFPVTRYWPEVFLVFDTDGDKDPDLAVFWPGGSVLLINDGTGRLSSGGALHSPPTSSTHLQAACADLDRDGDPDLVIVDGTTTVVILLNNGRNAFTSISSRFATTFRRIGLLDLTGDGYPDLVTSDLPGLHYPNNGKGGFLPGVPLIQDPQTHSSCTGVFHGDVDGDRDLDLLTIDEHLPARILLGNGKGGFRVSGYVPHTFFGAKGAADVDRDGAVDIVGATTVELNDGLGRFTRKRSPFLPTSEYGLQVEVADLNRNGYPDRIVLQLNFDLETTLNDGKGGFTPLSSVTRIDRGARCFAVGDVDGDGDPDLFIGYHDRENQIVLNDGQGRFSWPFPSRLPQATIPTCAGRFIDVDRDGDLDLVTANARFTSQHTSLTPVGCQNRLYLNDGKGHFTDATATHMPARRDASLCLATGDVNGDGRVDLVFGNWGTTPSFSANSVLISQPGGTFRFLHQNVFGREVELTQGLALVDLDEDGDLDLYDVQPTLRRNRVYLNDGTGVFSPHMGFRDPIDQPGPAVHPIDYNWHPVPAPRFVDLDRDGDLDLVTRHGIAWNLTRHVHAALPARLGRPLPIEVYARTATATPALQTVLLLGCATAVTPAGNLGDLLLDPSRPIVVLPARATVEGKATTVLQVPADPGLAGLTLHLQGFVEGRSPQGTTWRFTNLAREQITVH